MEEWRSLLLTILEYHLSQSQTLDTYRTYIVWHGGEPLTLPASYLEQVFALQEEMLSDIRGSVFNYMQTNLFGLKDRHVDFIERHSIGIGVSFDVVQGLRLTPNGQRTEENILRGMNMLRARKIPFGCIAVIAAHTWNHMDYVYRFFERNGIPFRALALREGGSPDTKAYLISDQQNVDALTMLFRSMLAHPTSLSVDPIDGYLQAVLLKIMGLRRAIFDRRNGFERVVIVDTDGQLYSTNELYRLPLGRLSLSGAPAKIDPDLVKTSLEADDEKIFKQCLSCEFDGACDRFPILQDRLHHAFDGECVAKRTMRRMEEILCEDDNTIELLKGFVRDGLASGAIANHHRARMV